MRSSSPSPFFGPTAWMTCLALRLPAAVITAVPTTVPPMRLHSSWIEGPPFLAMAPATPAPSCSFSLAALTMTSTDRSVMSPSSSCRSVSRILIERLRPVAGATSLPLTALSPTARRSISKGSPRPGRLRIPRRRRCDMPHSALARTHLATEPVRAGGDVMSKKSLLSMMVLAAVLAAVAVPAVAQEVTSDRVVVDGETVETVSCRRPTAWKPRPSPRTAAAASSTTTAGSTTATASATVIQATPRCVMRLDLPPGTTSLDQCASALPRPRRSLEHELPPRRLQRQRRRRAAGHLGARAPSTASGISLHHRDLLLLQPAGLFTLPDNSVYVGVCGRDVGRSI